MSNPDQDIRDEEHTQQRMLDEYFMREAIDCALTGAIYSRDPFGCVIVRSASIGIPIVQVVAHAGGTGSHEQPTRHCEMEAISSGCERLSGLLQGCTLYSTHEPCAMCCGAIRHSKISRVVFGSWRRDLPQHFRQNDYTVRHLLRDTSNPPELVPGVLRDECIALFKPVMTLP